jgi:hypothetical protein
MKKTGLILAVLVWVTAAIAEVREVSSVESIYQEVSQSDEQTLILLDVGGTLLCRPDPVFHKEHEKWRVAWFQRNYPDLSLDEWTALWNVVEESNNSWSLMDKWPNLIEQAHCRKIKVAAFTKVLMDPSFLDARVNQLAHFGLDVQDELPELAPGGDQFTYIRGVILTGEKLKGPVLQEVLKKLKHRPSKILFADDRKEQIESVEKTCLEEGIPFIGFHYTPLDTVPPLDESVAEYQLQTLIKERRWVSAKEVNKDQRLSN